MKGRPKITEHALLRYIERVCGIDLKLLEQEILNETLIKAFRAGASGVTIGSWTYVFENNALVTILPRDKKVRPKIKNKDRDGLEDKWLVK